MSYKIVRIYRDFNNSNHGKVIKTSLTLEEAQEWCNRDDTQKKDVWFDAYTKE